MDFYSDYLGDRLTNIRFKMNKYPEIDNSPKLKQLLLGTMLGNGSLREITSSSNQDSFLSVRLNQRKAQYAPIMHNVLADVGLCDQSWLSTNKVVSRPHPIFSAYRKDFYIDGKKSFHSRLFDLDDFGLFIWFVQSGSRFPGCRAYRIYVKYTNRQQCVFVQQVLLKNFNIESKLLTCGREYIIYIPAAFGHIFEELIAPHMADGLEYELYDQRLESLKGSKLEQLLLGHMVSGTGTLSAIKDQNFSSRLGIYHTTSKKAQYLRMKYDILVSSGITVSLRSKKQEQGDIPFGIVTGFYPVLGVYREIFYSTDGERLFHKKLFDLDNFGLFIWFGNSGFSLSGGGYELGTMYRDKQAIVSAQQVLFDNFKICSTLCRRVKRSGTCKYSIYIPKEMGETFEGLIAPYMIDELKYKLYDGPDRLLDRPVKEAIREQVIRKVAKQMKLPTRVVRDIVDSQFDTVRRVIELGDFQSVKLDYFGKFLAETKQARKRRGRQRWYNPNTGS